MQRDKVRYNARMAGEVRRYHTWPVLNQQTVADHTWHVMRIYYEIWGPLPPEVSTYILFHDVPEIVTGDLPFPIKRDTPELGEMISLLEDEAREVAGWPKPELPSIWKVRIKICDLIEMHQYGIVEYLQGNRYAIPIINDTFAVVNKLIWDLNPADVPKAKTYFVSNSMLVEE